MLKSFIAISLALIAFITASLDQVQQSPGQGGDDAWEIRLRDSGSGV